MRYPKTRLITFFSLLLVPEAKSRQAQAAVWICIWDWEYLESNESYMA